MEKFALVVTSIAAPNAALKALAQGSEENNFDFILIGDEASPSDFYLRGCRFYSLIDQQKLSFQLANLLPTRHYARKNLGYLIALNEGATTIVETDDDNFPKADFWASRIRRQSVPTVPGTGWLNVYRYFTDANIWPRGMPLDQIRTPVAEWSTLQQQDVDCPIQQGLSDENPDVDAIYRFVQPLPQSFRTDRRLALSAGSWCPFNSQNTAWWRDAFPLLYLPSYCSFRMTDIWRSFVAQRIAWANNWSVLYHSPNVTQERNEHDLLLDFRDEIPGYLNNARFCAALDELELKPGTEYLGENLRQCYRRLVALGLFEERELRLVDAWLEDVKTAGIG